jgi:hypothetical protein
MRQIRYISTAIIIVVLLGACSQNSENKSDKSSRSGKSLSDEKLLDSIQYHTFQYFWDGAEPNSGLARERYHVDGVYPQNDKHVITSGGSGFGIMAIIVGIERGFISREEGLIRLNKILAFLSSADRFHGVCPHWWNGETGEVKPFSRMDNGGDLVETSYLVQGLYAMKQYLDPDDYAEGILRAKITTFIDEVEWNWYESDSNVLIWHWSPEYEWEMSHEIRGYNECLITYVMAASSKEYSIRPETYHEGWARSGDIQGNHEKYELLLDMGHNGSEEYGGPLFWAHYSYLGLDPRHLKDDYTDYWRHNVNHTMIDYKYCVENPGAFKGYGENCWGLTASYSINRAALLADEATKVELANNGQNSYSAHSPARDIGVISPTAALSSFPYTPEQSLKAARYFYEDLGEKLMGPYGFYDAFSLEYEWFPQRYLAIDQGPIVVMIENYRSGLLWDLFMKNPEVKAGLKKLGFSSTEEENE